MTSSEHGPLTRIATPFAKLVGLAICEPKLRLGRRRHDNVCDRCEEEIEGRYSAERLSFPLESTAPEATTSRQKIRAMLDAEYERFCLDCSETLEENARDGRDTDLLEGPSDE